MKSINVRQMPPKSPAAFLPFSFYKSLHRNCQREVVWLRTMPRSVGPEPEDSSPSHRAHEPQASHLCSGLQFTGLRVTVPALPSSQEHPSPESHHCDVKCHTHIYITIYYYYCHLWGRAWTQNRGKSTRALNKGLRPDK